MHKPYPNKISVFIISLILSIANLSYADEAHFNAGFDQGIKTASSLRGSTMDAMQYFKDKKIIENYSDHPKETNYQNNPDAIKTDAVSSRDNDPTAKTINDSISNHPKFDIKADSPFIQNITKRSDDIYDVVTGQYGDCTKKTSCNTTYKTETCEESPRSTYQYCKKTLNIDLVPHQVVTHYPLTLHVTQPRYYVGVRINTVNGHLLFIQPSDGAGASLSGRLPANLDCNGLSGSVTNNVNGLDGQEWPSCSNGMALGIHITRRGNIGRVDIQIDITSTKMTYEPKDQWNNQCVGLENSSSCTFKEERCVATQSTHVIQGIPVLRDCWEKEATYQCGGTSNVASCQPYRDQGCEQIGSVCQNQEVGGCTLYQQTFRCPIKQCTDVGMICNGQTYCLDGNCVNQQKQADPDFQRAVSALSATNEAAKNFTKFNSIFTGTKKTCDKLIAGFLDCCEDKGWGKDHIAQCSQEEKDLKSDKEKLLTVYVGEYCKKDPLGICIEHRRAYCVFPSKLARIIQQQGRQGQLGISFGDPEDVNCRGITREEFAQLKFDKMDFSDFYADISQKTRIEDQGHLDQRMKEKMQAWEKEKKPHG